MEERKDGKEVESKEGRRMDEWRTKGGKKKEKKKEKKGKKRKTKKGRKIERKKTEEIVLEIVMSKRQTQSQTE